MVYFIRNRDYIDKYSVNADEEKLNEFKKRLITNCSEREHIEFDDFGGYDLDSEINGDKIINYTRTSIDGRNYFHYSYDVEHQPYLVSLIDRIMAGDNTALPEIYCPDMAKERAPFETRIRRISQELDALDKTSPSYNFDKHLKIVQLDKLLDDQIRNQGQESIVPYYFELQALLDMQYICSVNIKELANVSAFFGITIQDLCHVGCVEFDCEDIVKHTRKM